MRAAVYSFSVRGAELSKKISSLLRTIGYEVETSTFAKYAEQTGLKPMLPDHNAVCGEDFNKCQTLVFVGSVGIAVRTIAPYLKSKLTDPAVISVDERGLYMIPLLAGHIGGANEMARYLAAGIGAECCVTTATDVNGLFAIDEWAARNNMVLCSLKAAKDFAAALVDNQDVGFYKDEAFSVAGELPKQVVTEKKSVGMAVTLDKSLSPFDVTCRLLPRILHLGIGCRRGTPLEAVEELVLTEFNRLNLDLRCVKAIASVDLKKDEQGLLAFAQKYNLPAHFYTADKLNSVAGEFTQSAFVKSVVGVSNVCERSAVIDSANGKLLLKKTSLNGVTLAIASENLVLDFSKTGLRKN